MKASEFEAGLCPTEARLDGYLFIDPDFVAYQARMQKKRVQSFGLFRKDNKRLYAKLTLAEQNGMWGAPVTGAFGGLDIDKNVPVGGLDMLLQYMVEWLKKEQAKSCYIRLPPASFPDPSLAQFQNVLFRGGWVIDQFDINYHLPTMAAERFHEQLGETKRQETRRQKGKGAAFRVLPHAQAERAYNVIARNRAGRGFPMTMAWEAFADLLAAFPANVHFFGVERGADLLASAICLQLSATYLYVFYWGEDPDFRKESPILVLVEGIVDYAYKIGFVTADIGTSTEKSIPNEGLIAFKTGLGCQASSKLTFRYDF